MAGSTIPFPTVAATCRWKTKIGMKLKNAAISTAWWGFSTPVETTVAMELAASCRPFRKSKASARATRNTSVPRAKLSPVIEQSLAGGSGVFQGNALGEVRHVQAAVGD